MEADASLSLYISTDGSNDTLANVTTSPVSTWFHVAAVYEPGNTQTLYVNGISVKSVAAPATMFQKGTPMKIGWRTKGMIDEVRVFSRALTANEIKRLASE